jgi:hypothetical protein
LLFATSAIVVRGDSSSPNTSRNDRGGRSSIASVSQNYGVRLRKLHLVRPDLVPYPLSLEVYC